MIINHNMNALNAHRQMMGNTNAAGKSMEKLSSGLRINRAGDDAAGLAISEKMRAQIRGLDQAARNANDGISMIQTAEGALNETHSILQRMRELSDQSANGTNTADDRKAIQDEVTQLKEEIDRIGNNTEFNTQKLLNGNLKSAGGATVSQDSTTSSAFADLKAAKMTGTASICKGIADADFKKETLSIDGTEIDVNWQNLSTEEKAILKNGSSDIAASNKAKDLIISKINEAIDASGKNVAHVSGYVDASGILTLESGSAGTTSKIKSSEAASVLGKALVGTNPTTEVKGTATAGVKIADKEKFNFEIGGIRMQGSISNGTGITAGTTMDKTAEALQTGINNAIKEYNTLQGKVDGQEGFIKDVKVNATDDGRLQIISESGALSFSDLAGKENVKKLGLTQAQTDSSGNGGMTFQIGANKGQTIQFGISDMRSEALGVSGVNVSTKSGASSALTSLDKAIKSVSSERSKLGAVQNRLEHTINNLGTSSENLTAAESRIRDVDMAKEMLTFSKENILQQAAQAMLAQAKQAPQGVLQLLR